MHMMANIYCGITSGLSSSPLVIVYSFHWQSGFVHVDWHLMLGAISLSPPF